ncbi:hypothetical protein [Mesorhizobium ciceri]|uniref:hypothetical protein n=1 Tax=Mesorhizobium TaxID=68287 RepID=UPI00047B2E11|nr:hypothetical protein [Mesorhizobium ciceri]
MAAFIVTYDLNKETGRPKIVDEVKNTSWARLSESSYAISTNETADQVYARFRPYIDDNDNLYIVSLRRPYMGWGKKDVNDWLGQNLPQ